MPDLNAIAIAVCAVLGVVLGGAWYGVLGGVLARLRPDSPNPPPRGVLVTELVRSALLGTVVTGLVAATGTTGVGSAVLLGVLLWFGFPLVLWIGAVVHEGTPAALAVVHAGDWLVKMPAFAVVGVVLG